MTRSPSTEKARAEKAQIDRELDLALEQSFPASDPPSPVRDASAEKAADAEEDAAARAEAGRRDRQLDEALEETFPASDAPAVTQPSGGETPKT